MMPVAAMNPRDRAVLLHGLFWLYGVSLVGVLLSVLLLFPRVGDVLAPIGYGRWASLHLNAGLYGWCAIPLLGLLFRAYSREGASGRGAVWIVWAWTAILLLASAGWLAGRTNGKLFMEWVGPMRWLFPAVLASLWVWLFVSYREKLRAGGESAPVRWGKIALLAVLAGVPPVMAWASGPGVYPTINPDSGGATGGSLLGSSLAVVGILVACPLFAGWTPARPGVVRVALLVLGAQVVLYLWVGGGDRSHHEPIQRWALGSLAIWWPLLVWYLRQFSWPGGCGRWLGALSAWGAALLALALYTFQPGVLEAWKFTNALVAHSHVAMAGLLTAFNMVVLVALTGDRALARTRPFWFWNLGVVVQVAALTALGIAESERPDLLFRGDAYVLVGYATRLAAGLMMLAATLEWWIAAGRERPI